MHLDLYILIFSATTVIATIWMGFWAARKSKTAQDFFVAGRSVSVGWNASAISGEYLSAASFMGIAGMVMSAGYDALWYPVCYACGYLFLLLFIAGPLRRFGAYTIPDFAEGRYDSPVFRKIAVIFVLFIGFFYTMPQMKGAGTTLAYIFPGLPYWAGVVLVGAVITLNVAMGGMKGITLVQAFQYWAKMFAISVPIFVLMAVYGHYGKQLGLNESIRHQVTGVSPSKNTTGTFWNARTGKLEVRPLTNLAAQVLLRGLAGIDAAGVPGVEYGATAQEINEWRAKHSSNSKPLEHDLKNVPIQELMSSYSVFSQKGVRYDSQAGQNQATFTFDTKTVATASEVIAAYDRLLKEKGIFPYEINEVEVALLSKDSLEIVSPAQQRMPIPQPVAIDSDAAVLERLKSVRAYGQEFTAPKFAPKSVIQSIENLEFRSALRTALGMELRDCRNLLIGDSDSVLQSLAFLTGWKLVSGDLWPRFQIELTPDSKLPLPNLVVPRGDAVLAILDGLEHADVRLLPLDDGRILLTRASEFGQYVRAAHELGWISSSRKSLPEKAPKDETWLNPFGPLTTKAAKAAAAALTNQVNFTGKLPLRSNLPPNEKMTVSIDETNVVQALAMYGELSGRTLLPRTGTLFERLRQIFLQILSRGQGRKYGANPLSGIVYHRDGRYTAAEVKEALEAFFTARGVTVMGEGTRYFRVVSLENRNGEPNVQASVQKAWLAVHERPLALLYTYSLIIALVCGTAGLPHILVRFYTNPDGAAAKRTTMWVMILIGVFYVFPPIFGALGRNLLPALYAGVGAKGTDKIVLELPRLLNERYAPLGSILSGITCAGAFAAFMSTFSGLLVSMTGALAHDVYGRMLRPKSTPDQRMRAFKVCAVVVGAIAIILGTQVEAFQINFMVGQAFAIAAASYFPLLFMSAWWRGMTMKGAAVGMLSGGFLALAGISLTSFTDLKWLPLDGFWAGHPLARILCEQPAIWAVPLAITLMIVVSKLTRREIPPDIRMKMLVLHAPEKLGLKQEYIQEHQAH